MSNSAGNNRPIDAVRSFWEAHVNNEYYTTQVRASPSYYDEIRSRRYRWHYHLRELFRELGSSGGGKLLEIGCGLGVDSIELARCGFQVTGIDLTQAAIDVAKKHAAYRGVSIDFMLGNAEQLDFGDDSFDVVYSFGVLHHTPDMRRAISETHRVLKPGGISYVMLYHRTSVVDKVHQLLRLPYESPRHIKDQCPVVQRVSRREATEYFAEFSQVKVSTDYPFTYGFRYFTFWMPISVKRWLGRHLGWHLMIRATK